MTRITKAEIDSLMRPELAALEPYVPIHPFEVLSGRLGRAPEDITKLDANENPYGPSPRVIEALASYRWYQVYPDSQSTALRTALSSTLDLPVETLMVGHGADELVDLVCRLFLSPGDSLLDCPPTFGMYRFDAAINGAQIVDVPRKADFSLNVKDIVDAIAAKRPKLLFLCSPNNPDGGVLDQDILDTLLELPIVVIVDEAYVDFSDLDASYIHQVSNHNNLVVLRTFSKWAGLGGLRVGFGVFPEGIIRQLWKIKQPYNVNVAGTQAALASLEDRVALLENVARLVAQRQRLVVELDRFTFLETHPGSQSNFVLCRVMGRDARQLKLDLERQGVLVRYFARPGLENCIRVSAGRPLDTDRLLAALNTLSQTALY